MPLVRSILAALLVVVALVGLVACSAPVRAPAVVTAGPAAGGAPALEAPPGMPTIATTELPPEAIDTLGRIEAGGPFPYQQDGATFQNREGLLPARPDGYYAEYTVETPGSDDRGARRIITGAEGERYWTADHYASFAWIVP